MLSPQLANVDAQRLARIYRDLGPEERRTLLAFAEFLAVRGRTAEPPAPPAAPVPLPRPDQETVIGAIRRLTLTYPMLDRGTLLHETSALMSAHVLQGRAATTVIDELETLFLRRYQDSRPPEVPADTQAPTDNNA